MPVPLRAPLATLLPARLTPLLLLVVPLGFATLALGLLRLCAARVWLRESLLLAGGGLLWSFLLLVLIITIFSAAGQ